MAIETILLTKQGYDSLVAELEDLKHIERPKVIEEIAEARAHGDLKENAEYHAAREKQSYIEGRINMLDDQLARANVIDLSHEKQGTKVRFGSYVTVEDQETGEEKTVNIVGDLEADIDKNKISIQSPLAKALMGKELDDMVEFKAPKGLVEYVIVEVNYSSPSS